MSKEYRTPTGEEIEQWHQDCCDATRDGKADHYWAFEVLDDYVRDLVRATLEKWAKPQNVDPIPLSERKPGPEDCLEIRTTEHTMHFCWLCYPMMHYGEERLIWDWKMIPMAGERGWEKWVYWLPASTKYLPARVEG